MQFQVILMIARLLAGRAAAGEDARHGNHRIGAGRRRRRDCAAILEARVIYEVIVDDCRVAHLERVLNGGRVARLRGQRRRADIAALSIAIELVAHGERILLPELQVDARRDVGARVGIEKTAGEGANLTTARRKGCARSAGIGHQNRCLRQRVDAGVLIVALFRADKIRGPLRERSAHRAVELYAVIGRNDRGERVAGVECVAVALGKELPMQLVGARLGEHFDASVAQLVILGRKRIAVDANLADGRLGRQLPAG